MKTRITYIDSEDLYKVMESLYLKLDELIDTLAPEGWNNSPYHFPFAPVEGEHEILYNSYEVVAQAYKRQFGIGIPKYLEQGRQSADNLHLEVQTDKNTAELIYLIEFALIQLGESGLLFKHSAPHLLYSIDAYNVEEQTFDIEMAHTHLNIHDFSTISINRARHELLYHIDISTLYAEILHEFAQLDYDWRYRNATLEILWLNYKVSQQKQQHDENNKQQIHLDKLTKEIARQERKLPPDEVIGYISTYDKLPIGYPPKLEDLQALDNSIT